MSSARPLLTVCSEDGAPDLASQRVSSELLDRALRTTVDHHRLPDLATSPAHRQKSIQTSSQSATPGLTCTAPYSIADQTSLLRRKYASTGSSTWFDSPHVGQNSAITTTRFRRQSPGSPPPSRRSYRIHCNYPIQQLEYWSGAVSALQFASLWLQTCERVSIC
jgi:hypothetical protein